MNLDEEHQKWIDENVSKVSMHNVNSHPQLPVESMEYQVLKEKNKWDMQLYEFALTLYSEQSALFSS